MEVSIAVAEQGITSHCLREGGVGVIVCARGGCRHVEGAEHDKAGSDGDHYDQEQDRKNHSRILEERGTSLKSM